VKCLAPFLPERGDKGSEREPRFAEIPEIKLPSRLPGLRPEAGQFGVRGAKLRLIPQRSQAPAQPFPPVVLRDQEPLERIPTDDLAHCGGNGSQALAQRAGLLEGELNRTVLLFLGQLRWTPTAWGILQPVKLIFLPPVQPLANAIPICLINVGNLVDRVPPLTEEDSVGSHPRSLRRLRFHHFFELLPLLFCQRLDEFCWGFHRSAILPQIFCLGTYKDF